MKPDAYLVRVTGKAEEAPTGTDDIDFNVEVGANNDILSSELVITTTSQVDSGTTVDADYQIDFQEVYYVSTSECGDTIPGGNPLTFTFTFINP
jgi:hypothetical protein